MTPNYLAKDGVCPILHHCLRQLRVMAGALVFEDEHERVDELEQRLPSVSGHPDYVRLRGFLAIEKMLELIELLYLRKYKRSDEHPVQLKLESRSWAGLTEKKRCLLVLLDQVNLDVTEMQLGGAKFGNDRLALAGPLLRGDGDFRTLVISANRIDAAAQLRPLIGKALHSIIIFRPCLRSSTLSVGTLADDLFFIAKEVYGSVATGSLLEMTRELMDVKL